MNDEHKAVFLSYASQDAEAAKRICDALRQAGIEVWFDQSELRGGDSWDAKIRKQIKECALFVPIITPNTNSRPEGYFRLEWKLAVDRSHLLADDHPFLFPIVIGDVVDATARVPDKFRDVQWTRLRLDETPGELAKRVTRLLSNEPGAGSVERRAEDRQAKREKRPAWLRYAWAGVGIVFALVYAVRPLFQPSHRPEPKPAVVMPAAPAAAAPAMSEARRLAERARAILDHGSLTRAQLDAAGELCDRALQLDTTDALIWAEAARADLLLIHPYGYDRSDERRKRAQERAARASSLGSDLFEVRLIQAAVFAHAVGTPALLLEAEKMFRELISSRPDDSNLVIQLAEVLREQKRYDEAAKLFESVNEFEVAGWSYYGGGQLRAALTAVERSLRAKRSVTGLQLKALLQVDVDEDLEAAQATIDQLQPSELLAEMPAASAMDIAMYRRDPARVIEIAQGLAVDYLDSNAFHGPRHFYTGLAHELAGRTGAAEGEWRAGLAVVQARLKAAPDDRSLLLWSAWLHAALNDKAEAERLFARSQALAGLSGDTMDASNVQVLLRLRHKDALLNGSEAIFKARPPHWEAAHAEMRFSPLIDWERGDPRFEKQLRDNLPPGAKPLPEQKKEDREQPAAPAIVDQKSVAVLAFANLSDDKGNEYFSDGISEELLNVLAKIPGLKVSARTSSFYFKGKQVPMAEIAQQLGVAYVVEGSVRKQGDRVRITAQLIKAADGFHVWSDTFTRDLKDIFAVQDEIAGLIAKNLEVKMGMVAARPVIDIEAYQEYLAGRALVAKAGNADLRVAVGHFAKAVAIEPKFTAAWVQLASVHTQLGRWGGAPTLQSWAAARAAIDHAIALEPDSPDVQLALGWILRTGEWNWRGAEQAFRRALQLRPNHPETLAGAAVLLYNIGKNDEAFRLGEQAARLDPLNPGTQLDLSIMFYLSQKFSEAERTARRALALAPGGEGFHSILGWSLMGQRRYDEAVVEANLDSDEVQRASILGLVAAAQGQATAARAQVARMEELARTDPDRADLQLTIAWISAALGEKDRAFAALDKARASRDPSVAWLRNGRELAPLFSDLRWSALLHQVGLADDQLK